MAITYIVRRQLGYRMPKCSYVLMINVWIFWFNVSDGPLPVEFSRSAEV